MARIKKQWLVVALFFCCSFVLSAAPLLRFDPKSVSLGSFLANKEQSREFTIYNDGDEVLKIDKIRSTCGCAVGEVAIDEISPGDKTTVHIKILSESISGPFSKSLFIHSNDPAKPIASVTVSGVSIPLVTVRPQNFIYAGTLSVGDKFEQEFLVDASEPIQWGKYDFSNSPKGVTLKIEPVRVEENSVSTQYRLTVTWTPTEVIDPFKITIKLPIIQPEPWRPVELLIQGKVVKME